MAKLAGIPEQTFLALAKVRQTALVQFDSLFSPPRPLWTVDNLGKFHEFFVGRFDAGEGNFLEKYKKQLQGASDEVLQLAAELLYVQQFFTSVTGPRKKIENVQAVLGWCAQPSTVPDWAIQGLERGLARDQSFNQHRAFHIAWLAEFLLHWQQLSVATRQKLLLEPAAFSKESREFKPTHGA